VIEGLDLGMSPRAIRTAIDTFYADEIEMATPTPYPPEAL
jgi:hypothetical protein